jgi:hypothetical protein
MGMLSLAELFLRILESHGRDLYLAFRVPRPMNQLTRTPYEFPTFSTRQCQQGVVGTMGSPQGLAAAGITRFGLWESPLHSNYE